MSNETRIYFIRNTVSGRVKIGVSDNPRGRLSSLQTGTTDPLEIIAEMPGDERYEQALHTAFGEHRVSGEWFAFEGRLAAFVCALPVYERSPRPPARERREQRKLHPDVIAAARKAGAAFDALVGEVVTRYGIDRFCEAVGAQRHVVIGAIAPGGRNKFRLEWLLFLLLAAPPDDVDLIMSSLFRAAGFAPTKRVQEDE